jgi:hypothetical protein
MRTYSTVLDEAEHSHLEQSVPYPQLGCQRGANRPAVELNNSLAFPNYAQIRGPRQYNLPFNLPHSSLVDREYTAYYTLYFWEINLF